MCFGLSVTFWTSAPFNKETATIDQTGQSQLNINKLSSYELQNFLYLNVHAFNSRIYITMFDNDACNVHVYVTQHPALPLNVNFIFTSDIPSIQYTYIICVRNKMHVCVFIEFKPDRHSVHRYK
jgi:hypothetical protein